MSFLSTVLRRPPWAFWALVLLLALAASTTEQFLHYEWIDGRLHAPWIDICYRAAPLILLAVGMAFVIGTSGIDLSVGAVMAISAALGARFADEGLFGGPLLILLPLLIGAVLGLWNGCVVALLRVQAIVATLVLMTGGRGLALLLTGDRILPIEERALLSLGSGHVFGIPLAIPISLGIAVLMQLLVTRTPIGLQIACIGDNRAAARVAGIRVRFLEILVYVISAVLAGLAGLFAAADIAAADPASCGLYLELDAILAVVIGGASLAGGRIRIFGAVCGALMLQTLNATVLMQGIGTEIALLLKAAAVLVIAALSLRSSRETVKGKGAPA